MESRHTRRKREAQEEARKAMQENTIGFLLAILFGLLIYWVL